MKPTTLVLTTTLALLGGHGIAHAQWNPIKDLETGARDLGNAVQQAADAVAPITAPVRQGIENIHNTVPGVHFDPTRGTEGIVVTTPEGAFDNIRNLPRTFQDNLIPAGTMLADAIRRGEARALTFSEPVPYEVRRALRGRIPEAVLASARYSTNWGATQNGTIQQFLLANGHASAVTLGSVIVFASDDLADPVNVALWEHELTHVLQYSRLGIDGFAQRYVADFGRGLESEARAAAARPRRSSDSQTNRRSSLEEAYFAENSQPSQPNPWTRPVRMPVERNDFYTYCQTWAGASNAVLGGYPGSQCWIDTVQGRFFGVVRLVR